MTASAASDQSEPEPASLITDYTDFPFAPTLRPEDARASFFACEMESSQGRSGVAITTDAVHVTENDDTTRIHVRDIQSWSTGLQGHFFALTIEALRLHVVHLPRAFHAATVGAMTSTVGLERE